MALFSKIAAIFAPVLKLHTGIFWVDDTWHASRKPLEQFVVGNRFCHFNRYRLHQICKPNPRQTKSICC